MSDLPLRRNSRPLNPELLGRVVQCSYEEYAEAAAINAHGLMDLLVSPSAYQYKLTKPSQTTSDLQLGTLLDMAITEPERFAASVRQGDRRKVKPEEGQTIVSATVYDHVQGMAQGIRRNGIAAELLANQVASQPTVYWLDPVHKVHCKARLDLVSQMGSRRVACDIKTAREAAAPEFSRAAARYNYDLQMAHYLECGRVTGLWNPHLFFFIVVDKTPPYDCFVYQAGDTFLSRGTANRDHAMQLYAQCLANHDWPGPPEFSLLELPAWAKPVEEPELPVEMQEPELPDIDL